MAETSYGTVYSKFGQRRQEITGQRSTIAQQRETARFGIASLKRIHPKAPPTEWGRRKIEIKKIESGLAGLKRHEAEVTKYERELTEQESKIKGYQEKGYKVKELAEGKLEFYKPVPKPESRYGKVVRTEYTHYPGGEVLAVHYDTGVIVYPKAHMIHVPGKPFSMLPSHPEAKPFVKIGDVLVQKGLERWHVAKQEQKKYETALAEYKVTGKVPPDFYKQIVEQISPGDLERIQFLEEKHYGPYVTGVPGGPYTHMEKIPLLDIYTKSAYEEYLGIDTGYAKHPFSAYMGEAYKGLLPKWKKEYSVKYTEWETIPLLERKQYFGSELYFKGLTKEEKEALTTEYLELHPDFVAVEKHEHMGISLEWNPLEMTRKLFKRGSPAGKREKAWEIITTPLEERKQKFYAGLPLVTRISVTATQMGVGAVTWPITLPQLGVKFVTGGGDIAKGKTIILPDVAEIWSGYYSGGPFGGIQTAIAEGRSKYTTGEWGKTYEWELAKKYPLETFFGTGAEIFGLWLGGKALGVGVKGAKLGAKLGVPRAKFTIESYTGTQLKMPPVKSWLGTYKQTSMTFLKSKFPPVKQISTFKAKGIELSMMKGSPTTARGLIAWEGPTISQSMKMGLGRVKGVLFEPTARDIMIREGFYSTKFMPGSVGRLAYGKATLQDITAWKEMGRYAPSKYESYLLGRQALVDVGYGEKTLQLVSRMRTGEMFYKLDAKGIASIGYKYKPISSVDLFGLETGKLPVVPLRGQVIDIGKVMGYRYISKAKIFKSLKEYESYGVSDVGYRYIAESKIFKPLHKYKSYGITDVGYRYITKLKPLPKFKKFKWPEVYSSMEAYGLPSEAIPDIVKVSISKISKPTFTTVGGLKMFAPSTGRARAYMPGGWAIATGGVPLEWLEELEEGIYTGVHSRWGKVPSIADITTQAKLRAYQPAYDVGIKYALGTEQLLAQQPAYAVGTKELLETKGLLKAKGLEREILDISAVQSAQAQMQQQMQKQMQVQLQKQKLKYKLGLKSLSITHIPPVTTLVTPTFYPPPYTPSSPPFKPFIFVLPSSEGRGKRRKQLPYDPWGKGYRERKWKVPKMEDFLKGVI